MHLVGGIAQLEEGFRNRVVDDFDHAAAHQLLVLDQGQIGFNARGVAIHHEADGARGRQNRGLRVAIAVALAITQRHVPALAAGVDQGVELRHIEGLAALARSADIVHLGAVHADHVEEWLTVDVEPRAGSALALDRRGQRGR